jgi:bla regulator protein BlaR1
MNALNNLLNNFWTSALSMTLLHSLWQGLVIILLTTFFLKIFKVEKASTRYSVKVLALFSYFILTAFTFILLAERQTNSPEGFTSISSLPINGLQTISSSLSYIQTFNQLFVANQSWIVLGWIIGVCLFSLRFSAAILYLKFLREKALPIGQEWSLSIQKLSSKLGIERAVELCESVNIKTPVVIGYFKPIILMPIGLVSGLSVQQVEVILIHELAHIKRHDYLINFVQSLSETIFFYNPFVWILSRWIRNERENCCDDVVLQEGYDPQLYANTLFELESSRLENNHLALALTGNKNLLLNRIKRIMERSAKNQNGREKFIPILLLVLGLVFASWLSISPSEKNEALLAHQQVRSDTAKKSNPKTESYSRVSIIRYDEKGKAHEEVITENINGDEDFDAFLIGPGSPVDFPSIAEFPGVPGFPAMTAVPEDVEIPEIAAWEFGSVPFPPGMDTLPEIWDKREVEQWAEFEKKFTEDFKGKFRDFYSKNEAEIARMMAEAERKISQVDQKFSEEAAQRAALASGESMWKMERSIRGMEEKMRLSAIDMEKMEKEMHENEADLKNKERNMKAFEKELKEELVNDGYLSPSESINNITIDGDETITVNGKKIKEKDHSKYKALQKKHFQKKSHSHHPE